LRVGVFGGSFDPPHVGHLLAAVDAYEALSLDRLVFVPAATQPLKLATPAIASSRDRAEMVRRMVADDPRFEVSAVEIDRGGLSYMVDTLEGLTADRTELFLILGMDAMATLDRWKSPARIRELATLAVLTRDDGGAESQFEAGGGMIAIGTRRLDVSSSEIRERLHQGKPIRGFVPESVEGYISAANLYASAPRSA
jgi:nicotinate-nucleotide adenylyltransferase